ncbi:MAG: L-histidine N(alpha)-methyltransferase [Alphaproteobacteria bacterium]|nr:L-histidine N(alpha)-methyltransferase [Alphaproteobacteria bacterium]HCP01392.1 L-histidine N(alpha)-methyltransferase [Rhodospirillaceae bacterium]
MNLGLLRDYIEYGHAADSFLDDVLEGLSQTQKKLSSKYFYDERGSKLFDDICELPEYYPTRTETGLLRTYAAEFAELIGANASVVEFGSGSSTKVRILLDALESPAAYIPVDISREHLLESSKSLASAYPDLPVVPIAADYTRPFHLPDILGEATRVGFFPGSTIGNFSRDAAVEFLRTAASDLGADNGLLIGVDLRKDVGVLHAAYNDVAGITAAFNINVLRRVNRELGGNFDLDAFTHDARWVADQSRIEMHLVSERDQEVWVDGKCFVFAAGESIHTEDSHKYGIEEFHTLAAKAGWCSIRHWTDTEDLFSLHYLRVA